jgi:hypothetical protein
MLPCTSGLRCPTTCKRCKKGLSVNTDSDSTHTISLEVTVPRIVLPLSPAAQISPDTTAESIEAPEQVSLLTTSPQRRGLSTHIAPVTDTTLEVTTHTKTQGLFRLFRLKSVPIPGRLYLLRVQHAQTRQTSRPRAPQKVLPQDSPLIDDLAYTIEFRSSADNPTAQRARRSLAPGHHEVTILLADDGIPTSYSIDGAEV